MLEGYICTKSEELFYRSLLDDAFCTKNNDTNCTYELFFVWPNISMLCNIWGMKARCHVLPPFENSKYKDLTMA